MPALHSRRQVLSVLGATVAGAGVGNGAGTGSDETDPATGTVTGTGTPADGTDPLTGTSQAPQPPRPGTAESTATATDQPSDTAIGDVSTAGVTPARTGYERDEAWPRAPLARQWCASTAVANRQSAVAVVDGTVLSATPEGLRALDARSGERQWQADVDAGAPTVRDGRVYVRTHGAITCLGLESGRELWTRRLPSVTAQPLVFDVESLGTTVFTATERRDEDGYTEGAVVHALDASTGESVVRVSTETASIHGALVGRGRFVYGGTTSGTVVAIDVGARELAWRADLGEYVDSVAVSPETVFAGSHTGTVAALDREGGDDRWRVSLAGDDVEVRARPAVATGTVYVAATDGNLYAFDQDSGDERWRFDGGTRLAHSPTVVGADDQCVVVGSDAGNVFGLDASSGEMYWSHQLRDRVNTSPVVVDGIVYVGDDSGRLYALANADAGLAGASGCRTPVATATEREQADADSDGVVNSRDYAPRDRSVQRRADIRDSSDSQSAARGFLPGVGVGCVVSLAGVGLGYALWGRSTDDSDSV